MARIQDLLNFGLRELEGASPSARLDAEVLLAHVSGLSREHLLAHGEDRLSEKERKLYYALIRRRVEHEPVAYLTGHKEFWSLDFEVGIEVLVPRPETELLVELGLKAAGSGSGKLEILDLGTGSGCIAVALATELLKRKRGFSIVALDKSRQALELAASNAGRHGVDAYIAFDESDWFSSLGEDRRFDLILSNPPYVENNAPDLSPELAFEPRGALFASDGGFADIGMLIAKAPGYLKPGGRFFCETGIRHEQRVRTAFDVLKSNRPEMKLNLAIHADLSGRPRVFEIQLD